MKKIAIFVSGEGKAAERIVRLFNEGNRVRTVLVFSDNSGVGLLERLKDEDVNLLHIPDNEWHERGSEIAELLKENDVRLIVLDNFSMSVSDEIMEATDGEMIRVSSAELAPREVVAALEADLRKPAPETSEENKEEEDETPTPESEWASALKIDFRPPKIPQTPPELPTDEQSKEDVGTENMESDSTKETSSDPFRPNYSFQPYQNREHYYAHRHHDSPRMEEPMPSTWLIWSILVTVFCCFIPGIIAIIFSSQVSTKYYAGDLEGAKRASRTAEIWIIVSVVLGVLAATLYLPFMLIN